MDGDVSSGRVALVDARMNDVARLRLEDSLRHMCLNNYKAYFEELNRSIQAAEIVVFYCNHASSHSPSRAHGYLGWLKQSAGQHSQQQRVMMLEGGMSSLARHARKTLDREKLMQVFESIGSD